jgi:hypothetical protein
VRLIDSTTLSAEQPHVAETFVLGSLFTFSTMDLELLAALPRFRPHSRRWRGIAGGLAGRSVGNSETIW